MEKLLLELLCNIPCNKQLAGVTCSSQPELTEQPQRGDFTAGCEQSPHTAEHRQPFALCTLHNEMQHRTPEMQILYILHKTEGSAFILQLNTF